MFIAWGEGGRGVQRGCLGIPTPYSSDSWDFSLFVWHRHSCIDRIAYYYSTSFSVLPWVEGTGRERERGRERRGEGEKKGKGEGNRKEDGKKPRRGRERDAGEGKGKAERRGRERELVENKFQTLLLKITGPPSWINGKTQGIERGIVTGNFLAHDQSDPAH